ncbi:ACT-like protein tyrosine kinase family protein [Actinidia rufa]|uniref:ACT-like protein tyrosine kinase family protein n=1 Tax=Actinidia rufa TaxID=165716 RepID=A0A7J0EIY5_9ERIC|nr:ACT-like protein tyrosine kinase family protein [Actinidia rufa]
MPSVLSFVPILMVSNALCIYGGIAFTLANGDIAPALALSALLSDIGLNIREAHVFSTTDGYSLDVFVVDGWPIEDTEGLCVAMQKAIARSEGSWSGSSHIQSSPEKALTAKGRTGDWEIDRRLLKIGDRIASGSCGDLYRGVYLGQDVAIKILRSEHLNDALEDEFAQEVAILSMCRKMSSQVISKESPSAGALFLRPVSSDLDLSAEKSDMQVQHINVVQFVGACTKSPHLCIVTGLIEKGTLLWMCQPPRFGQYALHPIAKLNDYVGHNLRSLQF